MREVELLQAPVGSEPSLGDEEQHRLAALRCPVERALPTFTRRDAALRVKVEEKVVKALRGESIGQRLRFGVVFAGVADENARHVSMTGGATLTG
jgi:hypothetical protein